MGWFGDFFGDLTGTGESSAREQNQINREFQNQQSSTEVQRRRTDMEKAGINPILAAGGVSAASSDNGSSGAGGQGSGIINNITNSAVNLFSKWAQKGGQTAATTNAAETSAAAATSAAEALEAVAAILI